MKTTYSNFTSKICVVGLGCYFLIQLLLPMRHAVLPGDLYWAETGFRFSWRVMLMEKTGHVEFVIKDTVSNKTSIIDNSDYFTAFQIRELSTQPDMILQAANIIANDFKTKGRNVAVHANSFASLNGKKHQQLINPEVNLAAVENDFNLYWIRPHEH